MNHAVRPLYRQEAPAQPAPADNVASATIIPLSAVSGGRPGIPDVRPSVAPDAPPRRRASRGSDLIFGGTLAFILLIACLTWEMLSQHRDIGPMSGDVGQERAFIPAVH